MITKEQLEHLSHLDSFVAFLSEVHDRRESAIQMLTDRPVDGVQQVAGRILEADEILKMGGWAEIQARRKDR